MVDLVFAGHSVGSQTEKTGQPAHFFIYIYIHQLLRIHSRPKRHQFSISTVNRDVCISTLNTDICTCIADICI